MVNDGKSNSLFLVSFIKNHTNTKSMKTKEYQTVIYPISFTIS